MSEHEELEEDDVDEAIANLLPVILIILYIHNICTHRLVDCQ